MKITKLSVPAILLLQLISSIAFAQQEDRSNLAVGLYDKGYRLVYEQQYQKAIPYLEEAVHQEASYSKAWLQLGLCYFNTRQYSKAFLTYQHIVDIEPNFAQVYVYLGDAYLRRSEFDKAIQAYDEAISKKPNYAEAYYSKGLACLALGDKEVAARQYLLLDVIRTQSLTTRDNAGPDNGHSGVYDNEAPALSDGYKEILEFSSKPNRYYVSDKGPQSPSFTAFRQKLLQAAQKHDVDFIMSIVSPTVHNGDDGGDSIKVFKEQWKPYKVGSQLCSLMATVLSFGGTWGRVGKHKVYYAPYHAQYNNTWTVLASNAVVHTLPDASSPTVGTYSKTVVIDLDDPEGNDPDWVRVVLPGGRQGYVSTNQVAPEGLYAQFEEVGDGWRLVAFGYGS